MELPHPQSIPELSDGSPLVPITLKEYLRKFTSTVHDFASVSKAFGDYISKSDPDEIYSHVDYPKHAPHLAYIYPIIAWRSAVARQAYLKEASDLSREERFMIEEKGKELYKKFKERDAMIYTYMNITRKRFPSFYAKLNSSEKKLKEYVVCFLNGIGKKEVLDKLDIDEDAIEMFKALPAPSHEENTILELLDSIQKNQEATAAESRKDSIIVPSGK